MILTKFQKTQSFIIWSALTVSCFVYPPVLDGGYPIQLNDRPFTLHFAVLMVFGALGIASIIRWIIIPKLADYKRLFIALIVGLALSESAVFFEIFLLPSDHLNEKFVTYWLAIASMIQFCPLFLGKNQPPPAIKNFD